MIRRGLSLRWVVGGTFFLITSLILGSVTLYVSSRAEEDHITTLRSTVSGQAELGAALLAQLMRQDPSFLAMNTDAVETLTKEQKQRLGEIRSTVSRIGTGTGARQVILMRLNGKMIASFNTSRRDAPGDAALPPEARNIIRHGRMGEDIRVNPETEELTLYLAVPVRYKDATPNAHTIPQAVLDIAVSLADVPATVSHIKTGIGLAFLVALGVVFIITLGVSTYITQPLATLSAAAGRIARGELNEHVTPTGMAEIASLGTSFNRMAEQLRLTITRLAEERAQAESILTSMIDGVIVTDTQGRILLINRSALQICGLQGSTSGQPLTEVVPHSELDELLAKTLASGLPLQQEITLLAPVERVIEAHLAPVEIDERILGVVIVLYDITNQSKMEQVRRDFVANVSHELRTPVASIRAMAETLMEAGNEDPEMATEFCATIASESQRLTALLDQLLQLSRLESGRRLITPEPLPLAHLISHVTNRVIAPITAKGQALRVEVPEALTLRADRDALVQILVNLLDNARKYSPEGAEITVWAAQDDKLVRIAITDTGFGIPVAEQERIFERFYRVDKARSRAQGGTGLGLAIVKHLVELHGGRIFVESEVGIGTTFTVVLPQLPAENIIPEEAGELPSGSPEPVK